MLNKQIAGKLGIAEKTVKVHRARDFHVSRWNGLKRIVMRQLSQPTEAGREPEISQARDEGER